MAEATDDRKRVLLPSTMGARRRLAPLVAMALPQVKSLDGVLPSYVSAAVSDLLTAFQRWESDEKEATANGR